MSVVVYQCPPSQLCMSFRSISDKQLKLINPFPAGLSELSVLFPPSELVLTNPAESTHKGVNRCSKYVTSVQQRRPESPTAALTWHACKYKVHKLHQRCILRPGRNIRTDYWFHTGIMHKLLELRQVVIQGRIACKLTGEKLCR